MKNKINYGDCFNIYFSIPKSIKGDDCGIKEIKICRNRLFSPKSDKITLSDMNKLNTFKNQKSLIDSKSNSNIGNADEINTHRLASSNTYKYKAR